MAELNFDINTLFKKAFGIGRGNDFDSSKAHQSDFRKAEQGEGFYEDDEEEALGSEFLQMRYNEGSKTPIGQQIFMPMKVGGLFLPNEPTVLITGKKKIV